ncbi:hypothetical protein Nepgr_011987 [Nepenthes gracilis]|uniref:Dof zinc finger protein n=1 Tax=Nepenthes gracilis TaxID=150966 RepID=A0AAD3SG64_NEPGR|nr:hypothetical protein Nepgr_011987 [Nepenthes gracilis]
MVFPSIPAYLDPVNWQQQQRQQHQNLPIGSTSSSPHQLPPPIPTPQPPAELPTQPRPHVGSGGSTTTTISIRPGSMADRARMANIPMPEAALKCPRCESCNTKFCYFNNYSLSQPRHFCKTCRRYWTLGGALRNVPVGGGYRRNKRSKASGSRSSALSERSTTASSATSTPPMNSGSMADILGLSSTQVPSLRFMAPLSSLNNYVDGEIGLNYTGMAAPVSEMGFQLGSSFNLVGGDGSGGIIGGGCGTSFLSAPPLQFPFLPGLDGTTTLYPFEGSVETSIFGSGGGGQVGSKLADSEVDTQAAQVKAEENQQLNLSRQFLGIRGNVQYWGGDGSGSA